MKNIYHKNGLLGWTQEEVALRKLFEAYLVDELRMSLMKQNSAFHFVQVEAPILTPRTLINPNYTDEDIWAIDDVVLRPETTMGSYEFAKIFLSGQGDIKYRAPLVVWQHGKSFRREQDQPTKFMRLKEFYQLEFQIIYSNNTANDYSILVMEDMKKALSSMIGACRLEESDRLPSYSEQTMDVVCEKSNMEVCSMSKRLDFDGYKVLEVAIGTDRCIYNFKKKDEYTNKSK